MKNENHNQNQNQTILFEPVTPHPQPVAIGDLLADIENTINRHVVLSAAAATALAVWVLHTYVYERRDTVAYVAIESPEKRCGKTTLLTVLAAMANKPLIASNVTVGALFRAIDTCRPTLFIDEADTFLAGNSVMRGIMNSGNTVRTAFVLRLARAKQSRPQQSRDREGAGLTTSGVGARMNGDQQTDDGSRSLMVAAQLGGMEQSRARLPRHSQATAGEQAGMTTAGVQTEANGDQHSNDGSRSRMVAAQLDGDTGLQRYSCWCPKVIAMIGKVPDTIADRSIVVAMARKLTTEIRAPLAELDTTAIKAKAARFALDAGQTIARSEKIRGKDLNDRAADTFDPLFVIGRLAGKDWEEKVQAAALALAPNAASGNHGPALLLDIHTIFVRTGRKKIFSRDLVTVLRDPELDIKTVELKDSTIDECRISDILRPYGIKSSTFRIGKEVGRGYVGADFTEALARYVSQADVEARLQEIERRSRLRKEVEAEEEAEHAAQEGITWGRCGG